MSKVERCRGTIERGIETNGESFAPDNSQTTERHNFDSTEVGQSRDLEGLRSDPMKTVASNRNNMLFPI
jgi:hypothetical protein